jgi:hypothetical protein
VAILDDGVDIDRLSSVASDGAGGVSFARKLYRLDSRKPYYTSASGRGTEVANLALSTYLRSSIYIATVETSDDTRVPRNMAEV